MYAKSPDINAIDIK